MFHTDLAVYGGGCVTPEGFSVSHRPTISTLVQLHMYAIYTRLSAITNHIRLKKKREKKLHQLYFLLISVCSQLETLTANTPSTLLEHNCTRHPANKNTINTHGQIITDNTIHSVQFPNAHCKKNKQPQKQPQSHRNPQNALM